LSQVPGAACAFDVPSMVAMPPDDSTERRFVERLQRHDERAFNELVEAYGPRVYRLVARMLGRREDAEDMTQEVFVQVFKGIGQFRGDSKLGTWIYRVAINLCKNRSKYLLRRHDDKQDALDAIADRQPLHQAKGVTLGQVNQPDQMVEGMQIEAIMRQCIAALEPDFREALILRDVENLSYEEIIEITGVAEGTVKSRIHRARALLKQRVSEALGESLP
jgi:RNA polymerase sigma-70 factor, ECF subfamily